MTELIELIKQRRSIRKYLKKSVEKEKLLKIQEAGIFAPNPGGIQGTKIIILDNVSVIEEIGVINANCENRNWNHGVSSDQPSIIDDKSIKSGFYGCPALGIVCIPKDRRENTNMVGSAFICAQNMVLEAYELGVSSCIVGRAEATFKNEKVRAYFREWDIDENYIPLVFVCLGYIDGEYPKAKPRLQGRTYYIE